MLNNLPKLSDPVKYIGLYIFDFGDHVAVGYTAQEIEYLLAEREFSHGKVYKIQRAYPDGRLEIRGANPLAWNRITGLIFWFDRQGDAMDAFDVLKASAVREMPPDEFEAIVIEIPDADFPFALILRYVQELDDAMAGWLLKIQYNAGQHVESGQGQLDLLIKKGAELLRDKFGAHLFRSSRTRQEVLAAVDNSVQR